ncbi:MAG: hypothetical protein WBG01_15510, partial [Bacteroidota bacterium]
AEAKRVGKTIKCPMCEKISDDYGKGNYQDIRLGQTKNEVARILGTRGELFQAYETEDVEVQIFSYRKRGSDYVILVTFEVSLYEGTDPYFRVKSKQIMQLPE